MKLFSLLVLVVAAILGSASLPSGNQQPGQKAFVQAIEASGIGADKTYAGASWGDYNSDGYLDLLSRRSSVRGYRLYRNNQDGTFTDVTEQAGIVTTMNANTATFGDYDNNGCSDIYIVNGFGDLPKPSDILYHNNCDGTFSDVTFQAGIDNTSHSRGMTWGDYDNDGFLDIYIATWGILHFTKTEDAWKLIGSTYEPNILYHNNGNGTFTNVTAQARVEGLASCTKHLEDQNVPRAQIKNPNYIQGPLPDVLNGLKDNWQPVWFDYNNDGLNDLYVSHETTINVLYQNNGDGTFTDVTEQAGLCRRHSTHGVAIGDYDGNGYLDIYATGSRRNLLFQNNGNGTFTETSEDAGAANFGFLGWGVGALDYDNDSNLDLYSINGGSMNASVRYTYPSYVDRLYKNDGRGQFVEVSEQEGIYGDDAKAFGAFGDYNNDGFVDVFITSDDGPLNESPTASVSAQNRLYRNTPNGNRWLTVKLIGTKSNRDGIGAMITAEVGGVKQIRQVISGGSLLSQNSIWPTFGLGTARKVDTLTIRWSSGTIQTLRNVKPNQILMVREQ